MLNDCIQTAKKICAVYRDGAIAETARFKRGNLIWNIDYVSEKPAIFDDQIDTLMRMNEITRRQQRRDTPRMSYERCKTFRDTWIRATLRYFRPSRFD